VPWISWVNSAILLYGWIPFLASAWMFSCEPWTPYEGDVKVKTSTPAPVPSECQQPRYHPVQHSKSHTPLLSSLIWLTRAQQLLRWTTVWGTAVTLYMGGAGSPSNTMSPGPRALPSVPSGILIHPNVWPQYTKVTDGQDRQTGQWSHSIWQTVSCNSHPKTLTQYHYRYIPTIWNIELLKHTYG